MADTNYTIKVDILPDQVIECVAFDTTTSSFVIMEIKNIRIDL